MMMFFFGVGEGVVGRKDRNEMDGVKIHVIEGLNGIIEHIFCFPFHRKMRKKMCVWFSGLMMFGVCVCNRYFWTLWGLEFLVRRGGGIDRVLLLTFYILGIGVVI